MIFEELPNIDREERVGRGRYYTRRPIEDGFLKEKGHRYASSTDPVVSEGKQKRALRDRDASTASELAEHRRRGAAVRQLRQTHSSFPKVEEHGTERRGLG